MTTKTRKAFVISSFRDAGTEKNYAAEAIVDLAEGEFLNFKTAGLVRTPTAEELKAKPAA